MRTVSQNADEQALIWEALPAENRHRISRILTRTLTELLLDPDEPDEDGSNVDDEPG